MIKFNIEDRLTFNIKEFYCPSSQKSDLFSGKCLTLIPKSLPISNMNGNEWFLDKDLQEICRPIANARFETGKEATRTILIEVRVCQIVRGRSIQQIESAPID